MADFWGIENLYPDIDVHKGVSALLVNSMKGQMLVERMSHELSLKPVELDFVINNNGQLRHPAKLHSKREMFFELLKTLPFDIAIDKCIPKPFYLRRLASRLLSRKSKTIIKRVLGVR